MELRRMMGAALAVLLLVSVARPAMCGECRGSTAAKAACAGEHQSASAHEHPSVAMNAPCGSCGERQGSATKARSHNVGDAELTPRDCARPACNGFAEQSAALDSAKWPATQRSDQIDSVAGAAWKFSGLASAGFSPGPLASHKTTSGNSAFQPLSVRLKI